MTAVARGAIMAAVAVLLSHIERKEVTRRRPVHDDKNKDPSGRGGKMVFYTSKRLYSFIITITISHSRGKLSY